MHASRYLALFALPCLLVLTMFNPGVTHVEAVDMVHEDLPLPAPVRMISEGTVLMWTVDTMQKWTTEHWWGTGDSLILIGELENPSDDVACAVQSDFSSVLDGEEHESDPSEMMDDAKDILELNYVGGWAGICLEAFASERVYVAFEGASKANKTNWKTFDVVFFERPFEIMPQLNVTPAPTAAAPQATQTAMVKYMTQTAVARPAATRTPAPAAPTAVTSGFLPFDETTYAIKIMDTLFIGAGGRDIGTVNVANGRAEGGEIVVIVPYNTTEFEPGARVDEVFDILQSVGISISSNKLDVDSVMLLMGIDDQAALIMTASAADVVAYASGRMTKEDLASVLSMTDLSD